MKKVLLLLFLLGFSIGAYSQNTERTSKIPLTQLFEQISSESKYRFFYDKQELDGLQVEAVDVASANVPNLLNKISNELPIEVITKGNKISVKRNGVLTSSTGRSDIKIKGQVIDEGEMSLPGANVRVKGTTIGTITDSEGQFELVVPRDAVLLVSYIGYSETEFVVGNQTNLTIVMKTDATAIDEVVVIGYGTGTKEKFNGAVSKVDNERLNQYSSANFEQGLIGSVAGVQVLSNGKNPGDNSVIQIRGINSLTAGTDPLIVVDGNPLTEGTSFSSINNQDIESISILKDAASAAIYGSRASNGVILITTKKGVEGNLKVTYDGYVGVQQRIDKFELTDAYETALFDLDARDFGYITGGADRSVNDDNDTRDAKGGGKRSRIPTFLQDYVDGVPGLTNTDWADAVFRDALQQNHYLNLSGGNQKTNYSVSFGYFDQDNIIIDSDYKRYTNNIQLNSQLNDRIRFGVSSNISLSNANPTGERSWSASEFGEGRQADPAFSIVLMQPYYPIYNEDGSFALAVQLDDNNLNWDGPISENTIAQAVLSDFTRDNFRVFGNTYLEIEPVNNLKFKTSFGGDFNTAVEEYFGPSSFGNYRTPIENNPAQSAKRDFRRENLITENTLNFNESFGAHTVDVLVGFSYQQELRNRIDIESTDFVDDNIRNVSGATTNTTTSASSKWSLESYFSRLQYDFDNRYSISASLRRDGSSRFGANTKYGNFASVSAGWALSNEAFFPQDGPISFAKIRGSWGQTGNNQIGDFASLALISDDNYLNDGSLVAGTFTATSPNADLSWETNTALNFGLDLGFLNNRLFVTAEYYRSKTTDLLLDVPVPQQSGFSESLQNIGELENRGFELEVTGRGFRIGEISLGFNANITTNQNEVLALGEGQEQIIFSSGVDFITRVGEPIAQFYNYEVIGVYKSQEELDADPIAPLPGTEVGDYIVLDADGDGQITADDRVTQGDYNPELIYGFGFTLGIKGFDIGAQFFGIEGRNVSSHVVNRVESGEGFFIPSQYYFDNYFNDRNPEGFFRRPDFSSFSSAGRLTRKSNLSVLDGDYFRLRSLQIGYTFPSSLTEPLGIDGLRLYFTGNNIFNITDFRGYNADGIDTRSNERQNLSRGYVNSAAPLTRFFAFG